jgi:NtrC-family two-component system sensor histidine kinase KinB
MTLRHRILLTVAPLILLLAGLGAAGAALLFHLGRLSDAILRENYDSVRAMDRLNEALERIDSSFQFALAGKVEEAKAAYRDNWAAYEKWLAVEVENVTIYPQEPELVAELQRLTLTYRDQGAAFWKGPGRGAYFGQLLPTFRGLKKAAAAIHDLNEGQMRAASVQAQVTARNSVIGFAVGLGVSIVLALAAVWWLQRTLLGPIQAVTEAAEAIGAGQLHLMVPVLGDDEVGRLAATFNAMTAKLRGYRQTNTERLLRARRTAQATIDSFPDPVIVLDPLGRVELANPAAQRLFGVRPPEDNELPGTWIAPDSLAGPLSDALRQQRPVVAESFDEAVTFRLDGEEHVYLPQIRPIRSPEGETLGAAVVLSDVTRFRVLDRLKSDWVATVSHELKTPLTGVRLAVHVLLEEVVGPLEPKQVELLLEARDNTERLLKQIEHLLALARLEDGREQLDIQATDPAALLRASADDAASRAEDRRIELVVEDAPGLPLVNVDPAKFGAALNNLIDNALTYTEPGGKVTLSAGMEGERVRLSVRDTGIGIPLEYLPHVFDRFFRVPGRDQTPGTGLGLAIVREVILAHHGEITCHSEPGAGTTFTILLPAAEGR